LKGSTRIGNGVYVGPNAIITLGVEIGDQSYIGAGSLVNKSFPKFSKIYGTPARNCGRVLVNG
jgi:acetyltransferase-like isoleucine patch superfamily enzyme